MSSSTDCVTKPPFWGGVNKMAEWFHSTRHTVRICSGGLHKGKSEVSTKCLTLPDKEGTVLFVLLQ